MTTISLNIEELETRLKLLKEKETTSNYQQGLLSGERDFIEYILQKRKQYQSTLPELTRVCNTCQNQGYYYDGEMQDEVGCPFCPNS